MIRRCPLPVALLVLPLLAAAAPSARAATPGSVPAATLLVPYFEVDPGDPNGLTTLFSVNNAGDQPVVAHAVVWTDWGIPTYSFDLALAPDDVQTLNLRDLFTTGSVPATDGGAGSRYRGRFLNGGPFDGGTDLLIWLEGDVPSEPVPCGTRTDHINTCQWAEIDLFDEEGDLLTHRVRDITRLAFRLPVGSPELPAPQPFGFFELDHGDRSQCNFVTPTTLPLQAWVTPVMKAEGRFSVGLPATRMPMSNQP